MALPSPSHSFYSSSGAQLACSPLTQTNPPLKLKKKQNKVHFTPCVIKRFICFGKRIIQETHIKTEDIVFCLMAKNRYVGTKSTMSERVTEYTEGH